MRLLDALECVLPPIFYNEQTRHELKGIRSNQDGVRKGGSLETCGDIRGFTKNIGLAADARTNHYRTRIDADPRGQCRARGVLAEFRNGIDDGQASTRSALGIVVVSLRPPEVGHHAVALVLRDVT